MSRVLALVLYGRKGCHLCEDMERDLRGAAGGWSLALKAVDVDTDAKLQAQYGDRVPVLESADGEEICRYFLDEERLNRYLRSL